MSTLNRPTWVVLDRSCTDVFAQIVDSYHDEVCIRLRDRMITAAERDKASNDVKLPATAKLALLDEVMGVLRK